jgi:hypothetical protein
MLQPIHLLQNRVSINVSEFAVFPAVVFQPCFNNFLALGKLCLDFLTDVKLLPALDDLFHF